MTTTTFFYDGNGSRVKRTVNDGVEVTVTLYVAGMEIVTVDTVEEKRTHSSGSRFRSSITDSEDWWFSQV